MTLCSLSLTSSGSNAAEKLEESDPFESMSDLNALDDWANAGPEEATYTLLPRVFRLLDEAALEGVNWPNIYDLLYLTGWIYASILLIAAVALWIYLLRVWILRHYGVNADV